MAQCQAFFHHRDRLLVVLLSQRQRSQVRQDIDDASRIPKLAYEDKALIESPSGLHMVSVEHQNAALVNQRRCEGLAVVLFSSQRDRLVMESHALLVVAFLHSDDPHVGEGTDHSCCISEIPR